jgi:large subunit ribosomal protein L5
MEAATQQAQAAPPPRLRQRYEQDVRPELMRRFGYGTVMEAPRLDKITLNMGIGEASRSSGPLEAATEQLATISGQRPSVRRARKSIASFKVREGMPVGVAVTLRRARMWEFLDRLISIAIPRIRDFRGLSARSFDGRGNYSMGIREQLIFPEIDYDSIDEVRGLDVLRGIGLPFSAEGRPGEEDVAAEQEEERRKEEARERAEAEQAALEQLKEERPEAYERPAREEEGDEEPGEGEEAKPTEGDETQEAE